MKLLSVSKANVCDFNFSLQLSNPRLFRINQIHYRIKMVKDEVVTAQTTFLNDSHLKPSNKHQYLKPSIVNLSIPLFHKSDPRVIGTLKTLSLTLLIPITISRCAPLMSIYTTR